MRGCLGFALVATLLVGVVAWAAPVPAADLVLGATLSGILATPATVEVEADPPPELLSGHADAVRVRASGASLADGRLRTGRLDVRLEDVTLLARAATRIAGTLEEVTVGAGALVVAQVTLDGSSGTILAALDVRTAEAGALVDRALAGAGIVVTATTFASPRSLEVTIGGTRIPMLLEVRDGALLAVPSGALPPVVLLSATSTYPLELTDVRVTADGLVLDGRLPGSTLGL